jgi:hypothetical protein
MECLTRMYESGEFWGLCCNMKSVGTIEQGAEERNMRTRWLDVVCDLGFFGH